MLVLLEEEEEFFRKDPPPTRPPETAHAEPTLVVQANASAKAIVMRRLRNELPERSLVKNEEILCVQTFRRENRAPDTCCPAD